MSNNLIEIIKVDGNVPLQPTLPPPPALPGNLAETLAALQGLATPRMPDSADSPFLTNDLAMARVRSTAFRIRALAPVEHAVLIHGPSGTGKELLARMVARRGEPFIAINCAALTETLVASTLFGHTKGSFTGAVTDYQGAFRAAQNGTVFLDEIGDMPLSQQPALLRVIDQRVVTPVGTTAEYPIKCRIVAATNRPLDDPAHMRLDLEGRFMYILTLTALTARMTDAYLIGQSLGLTNEEVDSIQHDTLYNKNVRALQRVAALKKLNQGI